MIIYNIKPFYTNLCRFRTLGEILCSVSSPMVHSLIAQTQVWLELSEVIVKYVSHKLETPY